MADAVSTQTIQDGPKTAIFKFNNVSDGTGVGYPKPRFVWFPTLPPTYG